MVEEIIKGRETLGPLLSFFHPEKQAITQLPQLSQLLLQHLMGVGVGREVEGTAGQSWSQPVPFLTASPPRSPHVL